MGPLERGGGEVPALHEPDAGHHEPLGGRRGPPARRPPPGGPVVHAAELPHRRPLELFPQDARRVQLRPLHQVVVPAGGGGRMKDWAKWALDTAAARGAAYADVRVVDARYRNLSTKNGKVGSMSESESLGLGVRVLAEGAWGFASTDQLAREQIDSTAARASARVKKKDILLAPEQKITAVWATPIEKDPFAVSLEEMLKLLFRADEEMRRVAGVTLAEASMSFTRLEQLFVSTLGSQIHQTKVYSGAGLVATSFAENEIQKRSYPNSFGGQHAAAGYELIERLELVENARRVGEEAVALHTAAKCPEGKRTIILESAQLGLQIHESIGHPIELDRVLGMEANFAGMSFLTLDQLNRLRYGSEIVNVVADARLDHGPGLGTFGYDAEGG